MFVCICVCVCVCACFRISICVCLFAVANATLWWICAADTCITQLSDIDFNFDTQQNILQQPTTNRYISNYFLLDPVGSQFSSQLLAWMALSVQFETRWPPTPVSQWVGGWVASLARLPSTELASFFPSDSKIWNTLRVYCGVGMINTIRCRVDLICRIWCVVDMIYRVQVYRGEIAHGCYQLAPAN